MAYIEVDTIFVKVQCRKTIDRIETRRRETDEEYIKTYTENSNRIRRLFSWLGVKKITEDQAKEKLEKCNKWPFYPSVYAWEDLGVAEMILKMCEAAEDTGNSKIEISTEEFEIIFR